MSDTRDENKGSNVLDLPGMPPRKPSFRERIYSAFCDYRGKIVFEVICVILGFIVLEGIKSIFSAPDDIKSLSAKIDSLTEVVESQRNDIAEINDHITEIEKSLIQERVERTKDISDSEKKMQDYVLNMIQLTYPTELRPTPAMASAIKECALTDNASEGSGRGGLVATTLVAYNVFTDEKYTAQEIANQRVLLPYQDGTKNGYFYGELSESGDWNGDCTINVYEDGKLIFIKEATYENGHLLKSRQAFPYFFNEYQKVWAISDRTNYGGYSDGETRIYKWELDYIQRFESDKIAPRDIVTIDEFQSGISPDMFAYYHGRTSNGLFNDKTGNAYMVHFFDDGSVRMLYVGNFKDGRLHDLTGNAWYIVRGKSADYMYFKGIFMGNDLVECTSSFSPPLSLEKIKEIIGDRNFHIQLRWGNLGTT